MYRVFMSTSLVGQCSSMYVSALASAQAIQLALAHLENSGVVIWTNNQCSRSTPDPPATRHTAQGPARSWPTNSKSCNGVHKTRGRLDRWFPSLDIRFLHITEHSCCLLYTSTASETQKIVQTDILQDMCPKHVYVLQRLHD